MILHKTKILEKISKLPTELDFLKITTARSYTNIREEKYKLQRLESGLAGEEKAIDCLKEISKKHWIVMRNLWIKYDNPHEYDIILITNQGVNILEIKNYTGKFTYENGVCKINSHKIDNDIIQQTRRNYLKMRRICNAFSPSINVKGALVFVGEKNQVEIKTPVEDIEIMHLNDLYEYINDIITEENSNNFNSLNPKKLVSHLQKFEVAHPYLPKPLSKSEIKKMRPGIHCARCGTFNVKITKYYVECDCGLHEFREEAIVRTACEYGVLTHHKNFTIGEILEFIDYQASASYLRKVLSKHFTQVLNGRFTYYQNEILPYYKIYDLFTFDKPTIFYSSRGKIDIYMFD